MEFFGKNDFGLRISCFNCKAKVSLIQCKNKHLYYDCAECGIRVFIRKPFKTWITYISIWEKTKLIEVDKGLENAEQYLQEQKKEEEFKSS